MAGNFADLLDRLSQTGTDRDRALDAVRHHLLSSYRRLYPKGPVGAQVYLNESSGTASVRNAGRDITPPKFAAASAKLSYDYLGSQLNPRPRLRTWLFLASLFVLVCGLSAAAWLLSRPRPNPLGAVIREYSQSSDFIRRRELAATLLSRRDDLVALKADAVLADLSPPPPSSRGGRLSEFAFSETRTAALAGGFLDLVDRRYSLTTDLEESFSLPVGSVITSLSLGGMPAVVSRSPTALTAGSASLDQLAPELYRLRYRSAASASPAVLSFTYLRPALPASCRSSVLYLTGGSIVFSCPSESVLPPLSNRRIAVLADVSTVNADTRLLSDFTSRLAASPDFLVSNQVDLYQFNRHLSPALRLQSGLVDDYHLFSYFGRADDPSVLAGFTSSYDVAVVVAGRSDPNFYLGRIFPFSRTTRVYLVQSHDLPSPDLLLTTRLLQVRGGTAVSIVEALAKYHSSGLPYQTNLTKSYSGLPPTPFTSSTGLAPLLNQAVVAEFFATADPDLSQSPDLQQTLVDFSASASLLTPYTSFVVKN